MTPDGLPSLTCVDLTRGVGGSEARLTRGLELRNSGGSSPGTLSAMNAEASLRRKVHDRSAGELRLPCQRRPNSSDV